MNCKIHDPGQGDAKHFGASLGGGIYIHQAEDKSVTLCRHPADDVRTKPDVELTLSAAQFAAAVKDVAATPKGVKPPRAPAKAKGGKKAK